jgi:flagellin
VGNSLKLQNAALTEAQINAAGGVSTLQIADGALSTIGDITIRMQTLAQQAASGNVGDVERQAINQEFQALKQEIDRISQSTKFNGVSILSGTASYGVTGASAYNVDGITSFSFDQNQVPSSATFRYSYDSTTEQFTLSRIDGATVSSQTLDLTTLLDAVAGPGNNLSGAQSLPLNFSGLGVSITLGSGFDRTADIDPNTVTDGSGADIDVAAPSFTPAVVNVSPAAVDALKNLPAPYSYANGGIALGLTSDGTTVTLDGVPGLHYAVNGGAMGAAGADSADLVGPGSFVDVFIDDGSGGQVLLGRVNLGAVTADSTPAAGSLTVPLGQGDFSATLSGSTAATSLTYMIGSGVVPGQDLLTVTIPAVTSSALGLTTTDVTSTANANLAIDQLNGVLTLINQTRSQIGAQQSRLEFVGQNLSLVTENNTSAQSALIDVDVPTEITSLTNDQAMLQVGVSMLSQANRLPQILLDLLRQQ